MIKTITRLVAYCECGHRADVSVERTNDELEGQRAPNGYPYATFGTRVLYYCREHVPSDVADMWHSAADDVPGASKL